MRRNPKKVADYIENHIRGTEGPHDWDDFTSIPIADPKLNALRLRCVQLDDEHPDIRFDELRTMVRNLLSETRA
jgi:hypothetical protein